jgi:hypothetical protein
VTDARDPEDFDHTGDGSGDPDEATPQDLDALIEDLRAQRDDENDPDDWITLTAELADALLERYLQRQASDRADLDTAIDELTAARARASDNPGIAWFLGTVLIERWVLDRTPADIDAMIDAFGFVCTAPAVDRQDMALAVHRLVEALLDRDGPGDLDRAIAESERILAETAGETGVRTDLARLAGLACLERVRRGGDPGSLARVVAHWSMYADQADEPDPAVLVDLATVTAGRTDDPARVRLLLGRALVLLDPDDPVAARAHLCRALVEWNAYQQSRDLIKLQEATVALRAALSGPVSFADDEDALVLRVSITAERMFRGLPADALESADVVRANQIMIQRLADAPLPDMPPALIRERRIDLRRNLNHVPAGSPERRGWAMALVMFELRTAERQMSADLDPPWLLALLEEVRSSTPDGDPMAPYLAYMEAFVLILLVAQGEDRYLPRAKRIMQEHPELLDRSEFAALAPWILDTMPYLVQSFDMDTDNLTPGELAAIGSVASAAEAGYLAAEAGDTDGLGRAVDALRAIAGEWPTGVPVHQMVTFCATPLGLLRIGGFISPAQYRAMSAVGWAVAALTAYDDAGSRRALQAGLRAVAALPIDDREAAGFRVWLAFAYVRSAHLFRVPADLEQARELVSLAVPVMTRDQTEWALAQRILEEAAAIRRDPASAIRHGFDGLAGYAWRVLLAAGTGQASQVVEPALGDARALATRCIDVKDYEGAVQALDSARALVLLSVATVRDVAERLRDAGHAGLAEQWGSGRTNEVPKDLRRRALAALSSAPVTGTADLLRVPTGEEIQQALGRVGADALVYLAPKYEDHRPIAVIVPVEGPTAIRWLDIRSAQFSILEEYLRTPLSGRDPAADPEPHPNREAEPDTPDVNRPTSSRPVDEVLVELGRWAWYAAMREVMGWCHVAGLARPRLVLVPMGEFGLVPWHAASTPTGSYVVQDATISYAGSARLFCAMAAREPLPPDGTGLIVGDPDNAGTSVGREAAAIHSRLYPKAQYLGRRDDGGTSDGVATPRAVLDHLEANAPIDVLHVACHGSVDSGSTDRSWLQLDGGRLSAEGLADLARRSPERLQLGTVVLAACETGRSGLSYDEVFSIGHAFAVSGARSVVSTLWKVPDQQTSLLMSAFHHFLTVDGMPPLDALTEAQRWMLRPAPPRLSSFGDDMWRLARRADLGAMVAWAGFIHTGL